jgi:hypothetical protein
MALLAPVLLIDENYIKNYTWLNDSVDATLLKPAILLAQDKHLQEVIGTDLYQAIINGIRNNNLSTDLQTLINDYIMIAVCWWTIYEVAPHLYIKTDNGSLMIRTSSDTQSVTDANVQDYRNQARESAVFYTNRMIDYLWKNSGLYVEYTTNSKNQLWSNPRANKSVVMEIGQARPDHSAMWKFMVGAKYYQ